MRCIIYLSNLPTILVGFKVEKRNKILFSDNHKIFNNKNILSALSIDVAYKCYFLFILNSVFYFYYIIYIVIYIYNTVPILVFDMD